MSSIQTETIARPKAKISPKVNASTIRETLIGWLFISPAAFLIFIFGFFPIGYAIYMSVHRWRIQRGPFLCNAEFEGGVSAISSVGDVFGYLGACLGHYEESVLGNWGGAAITAIGFGLLVLTFAVWTNRLKFLRVIPGLVRAVASIALMAFSFAVVSYGWQMMTGDLSSRNQDFLDGLQITFYYAFGSIPLQLTLGLLLAYVLYQNIKGKQTFRMIFFIPYITPAVASAVVFSAIFNGSDTSMANQVLDILGGSSQRWLGESDPFLNVAFGLELEGFIAGPSMALISVIVLGIWTYTGYNAVIFLAGLGNIPADLYEAARVDGANQWHLFRHITLPLISPITFYLSLLGFIGTFKAFNTLYVMDTPAARGTLDTSALVIFDTFRMQNRYGEAAAQAIVLFIIILAVTQFQRSFFERNVFYG